MERVKTDSTKICKHVIIESDGFQVCVKCGVVQKDMFVNDEQKFSDSERETKGNVFDLCTKNKDNIEFLKELKSRGIINDVTLYDSIFFMKKWNTEKIPLPKLHHAYALYYSARKNLLPLTLKEISYYLQISVKDICKIEKFISNDFNDSPNDYISKFCSILKLTYMDEKIVKTYINTNYKNNIRNPSHVAIAAISNVFPAIEKKLLSQISWTAITTIKKISHDLQVGLFK